jgi:hypothetical protein
MEDETPDVDVASLDLRSDYEVIIVQPTNPRKPTLAVGDLPAKASPADLSFGDDHFVGGARQIAPEPSPSVIAPEHEFDTRWHQAVGTLVDDTRPNFPDQQTLPIDEAQPSDQLPELDDPCLCTGQACLTGWVDANIGCDVCAVFVCGETTPHACNSCQ